MLNNYEIGNVIPIADRNGQQAVNARHLYAWLDVKKDFSDWIKVQLVRCDLAENEDFEVFPQKGVNPKGGRPSLDYALSLNAAKEISMMSQTEKGKQARRYFIECERMANEQNVTMLPKNYKDALRQLLRQVERNEQLQLENNTLNNDLHTQQNINALLMGENDVMRPKAQIYDAVINTPHQEKLSTVSSVANEIGMSGQQLNKMLVALGVIYKAQDGEYLFTSNYLSWNLGEVVSANVNEEKGIIRRYIKWNTRGRAYIKALHETNWDKRRAWHMLSKGKEAVAV